VSDENNDLTISEGSSVKISDVNIKNEGTRGGREKNKKNDKKNDIHNSGKKKSHTVVNSTDDSGGKEYPCAGIEYETSYGSTVPVPPRSKLKPRVLSVTSPRSLSLTQLRETVVAASPSTPQKSTSKSNVPEDYKTTPLKKGKHGEGELSHRRASTEVSPKMSPVQHCKVSHV